MRVCHVINSLDHGGAEWLLVDLVAELDTVSSTVVSLQSKTPLAPALEKAGATVHSIDRTFRFNPRTVLDLSAVLASEPFDIVHAHLPIAQTVARLAAQRCDSMASVSTQHNQPSNYHPVARASERVTRSLDSVTVAVSQGVERAFTGRAHPPNQTGDRWCTVYNGIDVGTFHEQVKAADGNEVRREFGIGHETPLFLNVGRYVADKAQTVLIETLGEMADSNAELLIVGYGPLKERLRETAAKEDVADRVHVTGRVPAVHPYYNAAEIFVSASKVEGLPVTLLEAMAAELPVIAPEIGGIDEVVDNGITGQLYQQGDTAHLGRLLAELPSQMRTLKYGPAGYQRVNTKFDVQQMAGAYEEIYRSLVQ